jgi:Uma2 family endonuclease
LKTTLKPSRNALPPIFKDIPIIYEDEEHEEILMGENWHHYEAGNILYNCLRAHLAKYQSKLFAACNLNCYYLDKPRAKKSGRKPYFSADVMIIEPKNPTSDWQTYTIGEDGPPPIFVCEILSQLSGKIRDPIEKPEIYAKLGVAEYLLVDELGRFLPQPLLLKTLRENRTWDESIDNDGGITSQLGFRVVHDGAVRVIDATSGKSYVRPGEAEEEIEQVEREKQLIERQKRIAERARANAEAALEKSKSENLALKEEIAALRKKRNGGGNSS